MNPAKKTDFLALGSGLAGLTFALRVAEHGAVAVLTKGEVTDSNTSWAQGGIAAAIGEADSWESHERDTMIAGSGLNDPEAVRFLVQSAPEAIGWLTDLGAQFDRNGSGLSLGLEGGHSQNRIVHHADRTGWEIERTVSEAVRNHPNISVFPHTYVTELLVSEGRCVGANAMTEGLGERTFLADATLLATGGCGKLYQHTTNPSVATADGIALAAEVGAQIEGMEFMQFHPTTLYHPQMRSFLITEAVRGAGGTLRNHLGRRFMYDYDDRLELAPRDVVSRAIDAEIKKHGTWCVYLDTTHLDRERLEHEFPTIYERLAAIGIEMEKDWIPVVPAQHYSCGGVVTDVNGRTNIPGLYAAGEVASSGVHGANRLASNSLLEALIFARSAADDALARRSNLPAPSNPRTKTPRSVKESEAIRIRRALQRTMTQGAGIVRTTTGLHEALDAIERLRAEFDALPSAPFSTYSLETHHLLTAARFVVQGAIERTANVGLHFNSDLVQV